MRAQVTAVEASPSRLEDAIRFFREQVLPRLRQMDGFEEFIVLSARRSGKLLGVALWESEEVMRTTDEAAARIRSGVKQATGGTVASVENYEVVVFEAPSGDPVSGVTDTVGGATDSVRGSRTTSWEAKRSSARKEWTPSTDARRGEGRD